MIAGLRKPPTKASAATRIPWRSERVIAKAVSAAAAGRDLGDHVVERHGGEQRAVERRHARGRQRLRHAIVARPHPLGPGDQGKAEQGREDDPDLRREIPLLDRVADEEDGRQSKRNGANPEEGPGPEPLLPSDLHRLDGREWRR